MSANLLGTEHHSPAHPRELDVGINGVRIRSLITFAYVTLEKGQFCPQAYIEYVMHCWILSRTGTTNFSSSNRINGIPRSSPKCRVGGIPPPATPLKNSTGSFVGESSDFLPFFVPQDAQRARDLFTEETIAIKPSAQNELFEGAISYPVLKEDIELRRHYGSAYEEAYIATRGPKELGAIRTRRPWSSEERRSGKARSSDCNNLCRIYCDGVLVPGASVPDWAALGWGRPTAFRIVLNIRRTHETKLDLSRHDLADEGQNWSDFVLQRCVDAFRKRAKQIVATKSPREALYHLARLVAYGGGFRKSLGEIIGNSAIPLLVLEKTGGIAVVSSTALATDVVSIVPRALAQSLAEKLFADWASAKWPQSKLRRIPWSGGRCVFAEDMTYLLSFDKAESLSAVQQLQEAWLDVSHDLTRVRFLSPGVKNQPPLIQEMWLAKVCANRKVKRRNQATGSALQVKAHLAKLRHEFGYMSPKFVSFAEPFEKFFTAGWQYLNVLHPAVKALAECLKSVADKLSIGAISENDVGTIRDVLEPLFGERSYRSTPNGYLPDSAIGEKCEAIQRLFDLTSNLGIFELAEPVWASEILNVPPVVQAGKQGAPIQSLREVGLKR
jgi:hypothetical protein